MFEKVNPSHPDKVADRIAGAIVDMAYHITENPRIAVEVLIGHNNCLIIIESNVTVSDDKIVDAVERISGHSCPAINIVDVYQDELLAKNQEKEMRCGDNGIFKGMPVTQEQKELSRISRYIYGLYETDGKYILDTRDNKLVICQSHADERLRDIVGILPVDNISINPLGPWTGGLSVDSGATNRKLGSDMADSITGGGLHGKDLSKADVSVNIYAWLEAQRTHSPVNLSCAIGDTEINSIPYSKIVEIARDYIFNKVGGFEKFAEWGLV